jgi:16S rRNA (guanine966-N2)-methyltransferase
MRVVGGILSGRTFDSVPGHRTHPMSEKMRGAIFNVLGDIEGLSILDMYSGTGALSIEAISRGAMTAQAVDSSQEAVKTIKANAEKLDITSQLHATRAFLRGWSRRFQNTQYDLVFADPPYDAIEPKELLMLPKHVKTNGIIVLSLPPKIGFRFAHTRQELVLYKKYGDSELYYYRQLL